jgi:putative holliday junction resolvase
MLKGMKLMGIDYGTKRVGVAITDDKGMMAFPHSVLENNKKLIDALEKIATNEKVHIIVIGHSLNRKGSVNAVHAHVESLIEDLTLRLGIPIYLEPEQYTTQEAIRFQGRNHMTDASAATIILNSYITRTHTH